MTARTLRHDAGWLAYCTQHGVIQRHPERSTAARVAFDHNVALHHLNQDHGAL